MAIEVIDTIKPKNNGSFPIVDASDVNMPDGTRLDEFGGGYMISDGSEILQPNKYYIFGEVSNLSLTLADTDDGRAHEYCFEFIPKEDFTELTISPEPKWATDPNIVSGKTCQVSILRGIGVMVSA